VALSVVFRSADPFSSALQAMQPCLTERQQISLKRTEQQVIARLPETAVCNAAVDGQTQSWQNHH
jgi:hypothetical protein